VEASATHGGVVGDFFVIDKEIAQHPAGAVRSSDGFGDRGVISFAAAVESSYAIVV
jgi:hypothetical protein